MALLIKKRIKCSSLIEVVVAMVIVTISYSIGIMIYMNILYSSYGMHKIKASLLADALSEKTVIENSFFDEQIEEENYLITKKINSYNESLFQLDIDVYDKQQKLLASRKELIPNIKF